MKKLIAALAVCVGPAAFAAGEQQKQDEQQQQKEQQAPSASQREGPELFEATELNLQKRLEGDEGTGGSGEQQEKLYQSSRAFDLRGTLGKASGDSITVQRKDLPPVELEVSERTEVLLDGKSVEPNELPEGAQVRAKFQVSGDDILAVHIDAKSSGAKKSE